MLEPASERGCGSEAHTGTAPGVLLPGRCWGCPGWKEQGLSAGVSWAGISQLLGYSLFPRLFSPGAGPHSPCPRLCLSSLPANLLCHNPPAAPGAFPSHLPLDCSLLCLPQVWMGSCSWRAGACFHLPAEPGIAGEVVPVVLCRTWEACSARRGLVFIFYIFLASVHAYFLMLAVAGSSRCSCLRAGISEERPRAVEEGCRLFCFPSVREQPR